MIDRHRLMALVPDCPRTADNVWPELREPPLDNLRRLFDRWGDKIADNIIVFPQKSPALIEALLRDGRKGIIPTIWTAVPDNRPMEKWWNIWDWPPTGARADILHFCIENKDKLAAIQIGMVSEGITNHFHPNIPTVHILQEVLFYFHEFAGKYLLAPWEGDIRAEVVSYGWRMNNLLRVLSPTITLYCGFNLLDTPPSAELKRWLSSLKVFTGINYEAGARAHNLKRYVDAGMYGAVFYLPAYASPDEADERMRAYTTDVEG